MRPVAEHAAMFREGKRRGRRGPPWLPVRARGQRVAANLDPAFFGSFAENSMGLRPAHENLQTGEEALHGRRLHEKRMA